MRLALWRRRPTSTTVSESTSNRYLSTKDLDTWDEGIDGSATRNPTTRRNPFLPVEDGRGWIQQLLVGNGMRSLPFGFSSGRCPLERGFDSLVKGKIERDPSPSPSHPRLRRSTERLRRPSCIPPSRRGFGENVSRIPLRYMSRFVVSKPKREGSVRTPTVSSIPFRRPLRRTKRVRRAPGRRRTSKRRMHGTWRRPGGPWDRPRGCTWSHHGQT